MAIRAVQICVFTALALVPRKVLILRFCLIALKNNSTAHRSFGFEIADEKSNCPSPCLTRLWRTKTWLFCNTPYGIVVRRSRFQLQTTSPNLRRTSAP